MKKILFTIFVIALGTSLLDIAFAEELRNSLHVGTTSGSTSIEPGLITETTFIKTFQKYFFGSIAIITIGMIILIGFNLTIAEGNQEEFKKMKKALIYAIAGSAVVPMGFAAIKLITSINF